MFYTEQNTYNILSLGILLRLARCNLLTHAYTLKPAADGLTYSMHGCQAADTSRHVTSRQLRRQAYISLGELFVVK